MMPALFISDFGPMPAFEQDAYTRALGALGGALPRPKAIVIMSGHWESGERLLLTGSAKPETIHDYSGFPREFYDVEYPAPGAPALAKEAAALLNKAGFEAGVQLSRGLDHGAWVPLSRLYPKADVPVVQLSVPSSWQPARVRAAGAALAPLREQGVLLVAAGALIHNLRLVHFGGKDDAPDSWAAEFDAWLEPRLDSSRSKELDAYASEAPHAKLAVPTPEHFAPLFFILGAAPNEPLRRHHGEIRYGNGLLAAFSYGGTP